MSSPTPSLTGEPAAILAVLSAGVGLLVTFAWHGLTPEQGALWVAAITAGFGLVSAILTRPFVPAALTALSTAVFALLAGYHLGWSPETIAQFNVLILALGALIVRHQVSPVALVRGNRT
jgi:hypothetical protein